MELLLYIMAVVIIGFGAYQVYMIRKEKGKGADQSITEIRKIIYEVVSDLMELHKAKNTDKDTFIAKVIEEIRERILLCEMLPQAEKDFWTVERLTPLCKPIILTIIDTLEGFQKKTK